MASLKKFIVAAFLLLVAFLQPAYATPSVRNDPAHVAAIREVVETFRMSIINKDKAAFVKLFVSDNPEHITWQLVDDDERVAKLKKIVPEASRVVMWPENNHIAMIDRITMAGSEPTEVREA